MKINSKLESNIWKLLIIQLTQRRYYITILAIYFLTLPDSNAFQIGLWSSIGYLAEFLFEIPSGYISDKVGHKRMLILGKTFMVISSLCFIYANSIAVFIFGAIFKSLSFASKSGTTTSFYHETLVSLKKENEFIKVITKASSYCSLFAIFMMIIVPFTVQISIKIPLFICLFFDIVGLIAALSLVKVKSIEKVNHFKSIFQIFKEIKGTIFLPLTFFSGAIVGFSIAKTNFVFPYLEDLGLPIKFMGLILSLSSIVQFYVSSNIWKFEKYLNIKKILLFDSIFFPIFFVIIAWLNNLYLVVLILIIVIGYDMGRRGFIDGYLLQNYIDDKNYKATILSIKGQITMTFNFIISFFIGFFMNKSYELGFYIMGLILFLILIILFFLIKKRGDEIGFISVE